MKRIFYLLVVSLLFGCGGGGGGGGEATNGSTPVTNVSSATSISTNGTTLNGNVNPNGLATNAWFEWGTDSALSTSTSTPSQSIGSGLSIVPVSLQITGLAENTKYYFRVCASNAKGETESAITSFTTSSPSGAPAVTTLTATAVSANTATLNSNVTPNGLATTAWFEWGENPTLSAFTSTALKSAGAGTTSQSVYASLSGLTTGITYYYRVAASNGMGATKGSILSFTPGAAPAVTTLTATAVNANTATLNGNVTPKGLATNAWFEYSTVPSLASSTSTSIQSVGSGTTSQPVSASLTGMATGTAYYYRVAASNSTGTTMGSILSFKTLDFPNSAPIAKIVAEATFNTDNTITVDGTSSADADNDPLTFSWSITSKPAGATANFSNVYAQKPTLTVDLAGTYQISLIVNDGHTNSAPAVTSLTAVSSEDRLKVELLKGNWTFNCTYPSTSTTSTHRYTLDLIKNYTASGLGYSINGKDALGNWVDAFFFSPSNDWHLSDRDPYPFDDGYVYDFITDGTSIVSGCCRYVDLLGYYSACQTLSGSKTAIP